MVEKPDLEAALRSFNKAEELFARSSDGSERQERLNHLIYAQADVLHLQLKSFKDPRDRFEAEPLRKELGLLAKACVEGRKVSDPAKQTWLLMLYGRTYRAGNSTLPASPYYAGLVNWDGKTNRHR